MLRMYEIPGTLLVSVSYSIIQRKGRRKRCLLGQDMGLPSFPLQLFCREQLLGTAFVVFLFFIFIDFLQREG